MAWAQFKNLFSLTNIQKTNVLMNPLGSGVPLSSQEYQISQYLRTKIEQEQYRSLGPSGFITKILNVSNLETTTATDVDGELVSLTTSSVPLSNLIRLGRSWVVVNGWKILVSNIDGSNGVNNNITLDTAPTSGTRNDLVFLEVFLAELGGTSASIINTTNKPDSTDIYEFGNTQYRGVNAVDDIAVTNAELNRRWQIQYRIRVVDNVDIDTYPDGVDCASVVKAWGSNPNSTWTGFTAGVGSNYSFSNASNFISNYDVITDSGLYIAGDGSTTAKTVLGTVDGYSYAIPIAVISRRNSSIYNVNTNPFGCATGTAGTGSIASGISGRPDGLFYDQIKSCDILSLRHQTFIDTNNNIESLLNGNFDNLIRGSLKSKFGIGDGAGNPSTERSLNMLYAQEISTIESVDAGFKDFSQFNGQRRIFSDQAIVQQTQITYKGGSTPDNPLPTILSAPLAPTASVSTTSGTLGAGNYYVTLTYVNEYGETTLSTATTATLPSAGTIIVTSPIASGNATGYNIYISTTSGSGYTKQNNSPIAIGANYDQSSALIAGTASPNNNTTSSVLNIIASSTGLTKGTATIVCVDGTTVSGTGSLPNNTNILVYNANTFSVVPGTWTGLGTADAIFTPSSGWGSNDTEYGVVAVIGISYPAGNGMTYRPSSVQAQTVIQGASTINMSVIGVSGVASADNLHLNTPHACAVDSTGNIYVADTLNHRVVKYNSSLVYQNQFGTTGVYGSDNTHLHSPSSITVDANFNIYVSDSLNHRIVKLNSSLAYVSQFGVTGVSGNDTSHLNTPQQISLDSTQANIYIADSLNNRIVRITSALAFGSVFLSANIPNCLGVAVDANSNVYISSGNQLFKYNSSSALVSTFGVTNAGSDNYTLNTPNQLYIDSSSNIYVVDSGNERVVVLNNNFVNIGKFGVNGITSTDLSHLNSPIGITMDSNGLFYVADSLNHRILILHKEMGACDFSVRQLEVIYAGSSTDKLKIWYNYHPYQGIIGNQGSTSLNYNLRALTNIRNFVTTCGTGGKNPLVEDNLNGLITRMPFPAAAFGETPVGDLEYVETGVSLSLNASDLSPIFSNLPVAWTGSSNIYAINPNGNQVTDSIANFDILIAQNTSTAYPLRGVNSISRYISPDYTYNNNFGYLGMSFASFNTSTDHITYGYFLAVASGNGSTLPILKGEVVMVVVGYRTTGTSAALYGQTSNAVSVDVFRLNERPLVHY